MPLSSIRSKSICCFNNLPVSAWQSPSSDTICWQESSSNFHPHRAVPCHVYSTGVCGGTTPGVCNMVPSKWAYHSHCHWDISWILWYRYCICCGTCHGTQWGCAHQCQQFINFKTCRPPIDTVHIFWTWIMYCCVFVYTSIFSCEAATSSQPLLLHTSFTEYQYVTHTSHEKLQILAIGGNDWAIIWHLFWLVVYAGCFPGWVSCGCQHRRMAWLCCYFSRSVFWDCIGQVIR